MSTPNCNNIMMFAHKVSDNYNDCVNFVNSTSGGNSISANDSYCINLYCPKSQGPTMKRHTASRTVPGQYNNGNISMGVL